MALIGEASFTLHMAASGAWFVFRCFPLPIFTVSFFSSSKIVQSTPRAHNIIEDAAVGYRTWARLRFRSK